VHQIEELDVVIEKLRQKLQEATDKREALASNEADLRPAMQVAEPLCFDMGNAEESPHPRKDCSFPSPEEQCDDWERGLDAIGVAKCGVCGMKFPLDVKAIEQHSLECEAALKEGRKPARSEVLPAPRDRAASLRSKLAAKSANAGYGTKP